mmetsp:Transcript_16749/g.31407  ORF Transcript_16749/g.31407 Transcript_16749/m.31407 type:complete len:300 (+) Transcript_16749:556-1455(+)
MLVLLMLICTAASPPILLLARVAWALMPCVKRTPVRPKVARTFTSASPHSVDLGGVFAPPSPSPVPEFRAVSRALPMPPMSIATFAFFSALSLSEELMRGEEALLVNFFHLLFSLRPDPSDDFPLLSFSLPRAFLASRMAWAVAKLTSKSTISSPHLIPAMLLEPLLSLSLVEKDSPPSPSLSSPPLFLDLLIHTPSAYPYPFGFFTSTPPSLPLSSLSPRLSFFLRSTMRMVTVSSHSTATQRSSIMTSSPPYAESRLSKLHKYPTSNILGSRATWWGLPAAAMLSVVWTADTATLRA